MSEEPSSNGAQGAADAASDSPEMPPIVIGAQYIKDLSFENPLGPDALAQLTEAPEVGIEIRTNVRNLAENTYEVTLLIRGEAVANEKTVFIVELTYGGIITVSNVPEESIEPILSIDAPRHLFPFARSIIANLTRDGGFPPMMINPIDFAALYLQQHEGEFEEVE